MSRSPRDLFVALRSTLCIVLLVSTGRAQEGRIVSGFPSYRPVPGVHGVLRGHSTGIMGGRPGGFFSTLMRNWGKGFQSIYPKVRVRFDDVGIDDASRDPALHGPWLGSLYETTRARFKERFGVEPIEFPVCWYVLAVYVHKDNPVGEKLRMKELETVFSADRWNATWGDLGCKGAWFARPIHPRASGPLNFQARAMIARHCAGQFFWFKEAMGRPESDAAVVRAIAGDVGGMGLASLGCRTDAVRILALARNKSSRFVRATAQNVHDGSYPLAEKGQLFFHKERGVELDLLRREFLRYVMSRQGQIEVVRANFTPLHAKFAKRALAKIGLVPSGADSLWNRTVTALLLREVADDRLARIEKLAQKIGRETTGERLAELSKRIASTGLRSAVTFDPVEKGATIHYRRVDDPEIRATRKNHARMRVGIYYIWSERDGKATSRKDAFFQIAHEHERVELRVR